MGNRGGRFHATDRTLARRRWASRQWISCLCVFKARQRSVWGASYTEMFFLDEVTALAAGHRPCFECRRSAATAFQTAFPGRGCASDMDRILHAERLDGRGKRTAALRMETLPDGAIVTRDAHAFAVCGLSVLPWHFGGYGRPLARWRGIADVLTPPSILTALANGYAPLWHPSASTEVAPRRQPAVADTDPVV